METSTMVRLVDLMCPEHLEAAARWWPAGFDLKTSCPQCAASLAEHPRQQLLPTLTAEQFDRQSAIHEAGHAVVGVDTGHPLTDVYVRFGGGAGQEPSGWVSYGPWRMPVTDHLAALWAGHAAGRRWLAEEGLDTEANRLDLRFLAWGDSAEAAQWCADHDQPPGSGLDLAATLVDRHWPRIVCLADALIDRGRLTGEEATQIIGL